MEKSSIAKKIEEVSLRIPDGLRNEFGKDTRMIISPYRPNGIMLMSREHLLKMLDSEEFFKQYDVIVQPKLQG